MNRWLSVKLQYLQCVSNGDTVVLHKAIGICIPAKLVSYDFYAIEVIPGWVHFQCLIEIRCCLWIRFTKSFSILSASHSHGPSHDDVITGEFPAQRPVTRSFGVFFDLLLNKRLNKQSWGWWFETLRRPLWRHYNANFIYWSNFNKNMYIFW